MAPLYKISVDEKLYVFDEPMLFVAKIGFLKSLFLRTDETAKEFHFLSCYINDALLDGLREGRISIRGVFETQKDAYLVISDFEYGVLSEDHVKVPNLDEGLLPSRGVGLFPRFGECPDVLQEKDALVSVYFQGAGLARDKIEYSTLMGLLTNVQSFVKNVIAPPEFRNLRNSTFDFYVGDPALGSLMIAVKEPTANMGVLRRSRERRDLTIDQVRAGVSRQKDEFFEGMEDIMVGGRRRSAAAEEVFENLEFILPSEYTPYSNVTFSTQAGESFKRISISRERANNLRDERADGQGEFRTRTGTVVEINAASRTLLLRRGQTVTTCAFSRELFDELRNTPGFEIGARLQVTGEHWERVRRDYMNVDRIDEVNAPRQP